MGRARRHLGSMATHRFVPLPQPSLRPGAGVVVGACAPEWAVAWRRAWTGGGPLDLEAWRAARFSGGLECLYCGGCSVHKWGWSGDRRRYRCRGCGHTFSDFTGTPLAYLKRLDQWGSFCAALAGSWSVRRTARAAGVAVATAFRWRHRLLAAVRAVDDGVLAGTVAVAETSVPFSEKGCRRPGRPACARGDAGGSGGSGGFMRRRAWLVLARDGAGRSLGALAGLRRPHVRELTRVLLPRLDPRATLSDAAGPLGGVAYLARRQGLGYRRRRAAEGWSHPALAYGAELRSWLHLFRGVATKYLPNYLAWHRFLDLARLEALGGEGIGPAPGARAVA